MVKQRVFLSGATGGMGSECLRQMLADRDRQDIVILARRSQKNQAFLEPYTVKGIARVICRELPCSAAENFLAKIW